MSIPEETRREAYYESRKEAKSRREKIYQRLLNDGPMMAETLMAAMGFMDNGKVMPRLTELKKKGKVRPIGKVRNRQGKRVTLWEAIPPEEIKRAAPGGNDTEDGSKEKDSTHKITERRQKVNAHP
ncbi:hypothetical protein AAEU42_04620 [Pseudoflavonifractor phocaeensis]|uniref:hypothetical protein n=1 Tax=Pseudoflavonifractor phocaeensis TaxID=1870988 RepID=UPI00313C8CB1